MLRHLLYGFWIVSLGSALMAAETIALTKVLGHEVLQQNMRHVLQEALLLPEVERLKVLADWVLPSETHSEFRLVWECDSDPQLLARPVGASSITSGAGGHLISPVLHLVELAGRLNQLNDSEHVHPVLNQQVFLLEPKQVVLHQATNGIHDSSGLDPLNRTETSPRVACPLIQGWNRLKLEVISDLARIVLNGTPVYEGNIPPGNDRTFGLFHYADQTAVRVRNVNWTGQWPKVLPPITEQELRSHALDELEARVQKLTSHIVFDFVAEPGRVNPPGTATYSEKVFQFQTSDRRGTATLKPSGLEMTRPGTAEFSDIWVTPRIRIIGDFDIEATFEDLQLATPSNGANAINLMVVTEDEQTTHSRVWLGANAQPGAEFRHATQAEFNRYQKDRGVSIDFQGVT